LPEASVGASVAAAAAGPSPDAEAAATASPPALASLSGSEVVAGDWERSGVSIEGVGMEQAGR